MADLTIIGVPQSTYVWVIRMACAEKGVEYTFDPQPPHSAAVSAIHPFGKVPVMRHGDVEIAESEAIARYLDRAFDGPALFPADPVAAAAVDQWVSLVNTRIDGVLVRQYLFAYVFPQTEDGSPNQARIAACLDEVKHLLELLETTVGRNGHLATADMTYADLNVYPILFYLSTLPESGAFMKTLPRLSAYTATLTARPGAQATIPPAPEAR